MGVFDRAVFLFFFNKIKRAVCESTLGGILASSRNAIEAKVGN